MKKLLLLPLVVFFIGCETPQEKNKKEIQKLKQQVEILAKKVDSLPKDTPNLSQIKQKLADLKKQVGINTKELNSLKEKVSKNSEKINNIVSKIDENKKEIVKLKQTQFDYIVIKPTTLITTKDTKIYAKPNINSKVVMNFEANRTFTSYKERNNFIKITGYFVDGKWRPNKKEWWIQKDNCKIKRVDK